MVASILLFYLVLLFNNKFFAFWNEEVIIGFYNDDSYGVVGEDVSRFVTQKIS